MSCPLNAAAGFPLIEIDASASGSGECDLSGDGGEERCEQPGAANSHSIVSEKEFIPAAIRAGAFGMVERRRTTPRSQYEEASCIDKQEAD